MRPDSLETMVSYKFITYLLAFILKNCFICEIAVTVTCQFEPMRTDKADEKKWETFTSLGPTR